MCAVLSPCVWFWHSACVFNNLAFDFHTHASDLITHACNFDTLRVKLLHYNIYINLSCRYSYPHACRINTLCGIVTVPYCVLIEHAYVFKIFNCCWFWSIKKFGYFQNIKILILPFLTLIQLSASDELMFYQHTFCCFTGVKNVILFSN
jgi:hypothetical protein